jgi:hypothetical protein
MRAAPIDIRWHSGLPIFASEAFLKAVSDDYGWLGGIDDSGQLRCILPYTIVRKSIIRMGRFRVETIPCGEGLEVAEERAFLHSTVEYLRAVGVDIIIPPSSNTVFRTYPDGVDAAPYGSYVIDLCQAEDILWRNIGRITRQNIRKAQKDGVSIRSGLEHLDVAYALIRNTFARSRLPFMNQASFRRFALGLGENGQLMVAEYQGVIQSCTVFAFSHPCAYAIYAGNIPKQHQGANKLIYWEAITAFQKRGIRRFDFHGARIAPAKGSKQETMNLLKQHFGATLKQGYMWKCHLSPVKSLAYSLAVRFLRGGDIVDHERHKLTRPDNAIPHAPKAREQA